MKDVKNIDAKALRIKTGKNQTAFWSPLGVTQSGGSRYESGRNIPEPVRKLLVIAYGTDKQSADEVQKLRPAVASVAKLPVKKVAA